MSFQRIAPLALLVLGGGCGPLPVTDALDSATPGTDGGADRPPFEALHDFPAFEIAPATELYGDCQSWTLNNPEPLYVNAIHMSSNGGFHHSNWFFVPEARYPGEDGTWDCSDRGFSEVDAASRGGGVFYAQSTQTASETQQFQPGVVLVVPPYAKIVGGVHLLNVNATTLTTHIGFSLDVIDESAVGVRLAPLNFNHLHLDIPPRSTAQFQSECDIATTYQNNLRRDVDFKVYYVLPHYHTLARLMRIEVIGGIADGQVLFETTSSIGESLGRTLDVPFDMTGATAVRTTCLFENTTDRRVVTGIGTNEMCVFLAYTDSSLSIGSATTGNTVDGIVDGVIQNTAPCVAIGFRSMVPSTSP